MPRFVAAYLAFIVLFSFSTCNVEVLADEKLPNILWLSTEDIGPELNCYGDSTAKTPTLDQLASNGLTYDVAWSNYPVCAPARTTIITGVYAATLAAGNMRSQMPLPPERKLFPQYLRELGYYCTNNSKEDYNVIKPGKVWDQSNKKAHYKNRKDGQPFFAVFNHTGTHESQIRKRPHQAVIDPSSVKLKSYWPDTPEVRQDLAQYYDNLQRMDGWVKRQLKELEESGEADNTIVVFFGDHGSGMPRHKRFAGDSGQRVPFVVHVPENLKHLAPSDYQAGGRTQRPVGFVDLAPTMLSLAGIKAPEYMEGHAFMGAHPAPEPKYLFGYRDRMDERPDFSRAVRDERFIYVRNYMPHLPAGQFVHYQNETPTTAIWRKMFHAGQLNEVHSQFFLPHPPEELYDLQADPEETKNLVNDSTYMEPLNRLREAHKMRVLDSVDSGFIPEGMLYEALKSGPDAWETVDAELQYDVEKTFELAQLAASVDGDTSQLLAAAKSENAILRYWAAAGLRYRVQSAVKDHVAVLHQLVNDDSPAVAIMAAETLSMSPNYETALVGIEKLKVLANHKNSNPFHAIRALNAIDALDAKANSIMEDMKALPVDDGLKRGGGYLKRLVPDILSSR